MVSQVAHQIFTPGTTSSNKYPHCLEFCAPIQRTIVCLRYIIDDDMLIIHLNNNNKNPNMIYVTPLQTIEMQIYILNGLMIHIHMRLNAHHNPWFLVHIFFYVFLYRGWLCEGVKVIPGGVSLCSGRVAFDLNRSVAQSLFSSVCQKPLSHTTHPWLEFFHARSMLCIFAVCDVGCWSNMHRAIYSEHEKCIFVRSR